MPQPSTCPGHLHAPAIRFSSLQGNNSYSYMPLPSVFQGVQDCRLPGLKRSKPSAGLQGNNSYSYTCPCHLFFSGFKTAVCPASNPPNASAGLQGNNSYSYMPLPSVFQGVQDCVCPASNPPNASAGLQGNNSYSYMPLPSVFQRVQGCRLPGLKPSKPFRRPPRQQLLQLHAPAICFSGGSRLPFAQPQTLQTLRQASKATTLTATCPCHLFFSGFKTAVCPASNPPNASAGLQGNNSYSYIPLPSVFQRVQDCHCRLPGLKPSKRFRRPPRQQLLQLHAPAICFFKGFKTAVCPASNPPNPSAGLQGNNSYSYMPLPSVFQGVQDCRLPGLKPSKRFCRPPRQQLLQLHSPAICFSAGSRLPSARPQTLQTFRRPPRQQLLQLHAPAICFFKGFKTAVCPASNPPNPSAGLQEATTLTATCPCHLFFSGFKTAVCPASNPPNASAGLQGNNSYSYMPLPSAFSGGSRLPFARPQTLQTLPQASKATTLTATCPCHLFFRGFKSSRLPFARPSNPPNPSASLQGNNSYS